MIDVENLVKRYGAFTAVAGISFKADAGEILGFLGPNGAGKTTTMRMLTGYMPPTAGTAKVAGFDVFEQSLEVRKNVGYLPETVPLYPDMTVKSYVRYIADLRRVPKAASRVEDVLKAVGMYNRRDSLIRNASKGMRQRIGLAQALVHDPAVLILDEPTIGLDPLQVTEVRELVRDLGKKHTVMFSTHILSEAEQICDRVIILNSGQIVAMDTPIHLRDRLQHGASQYVRLGGKLTDSDTAKRVLFSVAGVTNVEPYGGEDANGYIVRVHEAVDVRSRLASAIFEAGGELLELRPLAVSLEDIFIELTAQQASKGDHLDVDEPSPTRQPERKKARA
ncbi:MAG: ABC transporter ATP-binding protein [Anaerolineae bacterium]|nr:ABC transporter ATP-binding protein [Anaerolineae bacterium]